MSRHSLWTRIAALAAVLILSSAGAIGCAGDKEIEDETPPTTGEVEIEDDETEYEVEKELAEGEQSPVEEGEYDTKFGEAEVDVEGDEVEIEGEREYPDDGNPYYAEDMPDEMKGQIKIKNPQPAQAVRIVEVMKVKPIPADYIGTTVKGRVKVTNVISDRGFWITNGEQRVFAVVREDVPQHEMIDINKGQVLEFVGVLTDGENWRALEGLLEEDTKETLKKQDYFVAMYWDDINIVGQPPAAEKPSAQR